MKFRMERWAAVLGALVLSAFMATPAHATLELRITENGGAPVIYTDGGTGSIAISVADALFNVNLHIASSNSPGTTSVALLHADSTVKATALGLAGGGTIKIEVSDIGFTNPIGVAGTLLMEVNTNTNGASAATGSNVFQGYYKSGNSYFDTTGTTTGSTGFSSYSNSNSADKSATVAPVSSPYSLNVVSTLTFTNTNQGQATMNLSLSTVPEPTSVLLLGTAMFGIAGLLRKKLSGRRA